jgi:DNA repair exonuclease SbcCD ATPase subunit
MEQNGLKTGAKFESLAKRISDLAPDQPLDLKYITNEMKQVRPTQGKLTRAVTSVEDVGINDLQSWFMDWVESVAPEYKDLTSKSKTVIQVRNYLAQKAKPGDVFETSGMTKMVKDLASGKLSSADTQRINILEQGTGGFKGAGEFTGQVKQKGQQIADFKVKMEDAQRKLKDAATNAESLSDTMSILQTNKRNEISRKIQDIQDTIESKKKIEASDIAKIQSELDTLTNELNAKIEKIKSGPLTGEKNIRRLKDSVSAINVIRKAVGVAAGTAIGTSAAMASLRSIGRALRYNIGNNE